MTDDPIMAEVRATRDRLAARFDYDLEAIFRHIQEREARSGLTYVTYPPRRPASADGVQDSGRHGQSPSESSTTSAAVMRGLACDEQHAERTRGMKNITLSADDDLIEAAQKRAASEHTTLNEQFRRWLVDYVGRKQQAAEAAQVMRELQGRLNVGRRLTREERNER